MKVTDFIFVGVYEREQDLFEHMVEEAREAFGFEINIYPALGLGVACQQLLFAVETPEISSFQRAKLAGFLSGRSFEVRPFCMELNTPLSRQILANSCLVRLKLPSERSLTEAWVQLDSLSESVSEPNGRGLNFAVFRHEKLEGKPFVAVIWNKENTQNLDYWQKWLSDKMKEDYSSVVFRRVFIHE